MADNKAQTHLLVVDDNEMNRDLLSRRLLRQGYQVHVAGTGGEALERLRSQAIDLVLLDVMMPDVDGLEVLTTIRETHSLVDLPVIMVSARDQSGDMAAALQMGANDYATKPINFPLIFAKIQTQLNIKEGARGARSAAPSSGSGSGERPASGDSQHSTAVDFPTLGDRPTIGDYEILAELGHGGMGIVYKARHLRMNRIVALKVIHRERLSRPDAVRRFYQEVELAAKLQHPNIVLAFDAGQSADTHFFAMEYIEGQDLVQQVRQHGALPIDQACDFIRQAALGLQHAHELGMVHRDIKPSNLFVTWTARPSSSTSSSDSGVGLGRPPRPSTTNPVAVIKILDFGLARLHQTTENRTNPAVELTREGRVIGSVDYMAPEQWMNASKVDIRADLYSLGCTFYYLLSAQVPFPGEEPMEKMLKHHLDQPLSLEKLRPETPQKVLGVVHRLMAKRREDRYQTPGELAQLLSWISQADFGSEKMK